MENNSLSLVIPVYNTGYLLAESIKSIGQQKGENLSRWKIEAIFVDDASSDQTTRKILNDIPEKLGVITTKVIRNPTSLGAGGARNMGILFSSGTWIAFLDADDLLIENSIDIRINAIELDDSIEFISTDMYQWNEYLSNEFPGFRKYHNNNLITKNSKQDGFWIENTFDEFISNIPVHPNTAMVRKSLLAKAGLFNKQLLRGQDVDLWRRLALHANLFFINQPTAIFRVSDGTQQRMNGNWFDYDLMSINNLIQITKSPEFKIGLKKLKHKTLMDKLFFNSKSGNIKSVLSIYIQALITYPASFKNLNYAPQLVYVFINHLKAKKLTN